MLMTMADVSCDRHTGELIRSSRSRFWWSNQSSNQLENIPAENFFLIVHHSFILYWSRKKDLFSTVMLKRVLGQATGTWFRSQAQWETHLDMIKRHSAAAKQLRQGRDSKTHSKMNSYTLEVKKLIPWWCKEWLICWWPHVGIFQPPLKTPEGLVFFF